MHRRLALAAILAASWMGPGRAADNSFEADRFQFIDSEMPELGILSVDISRIAKHGDSATVVLAAWQRADQAPLTLITLTYEFNCAARTSRIAKLEGWGPDGSLLQAQTFELAYEKDQPQTLSGLLDTMACGQHPEISNAAVIAGWSAAREEARRYEAAHPAP